MSIVKNPATVFLCTLIIVACTASSLSARSTRSLVAESGLEGGLIVYVGSADAALVTSLRPSDNFRVQALDPSESNVQTVRRQMLLSGTYGGASVVTWHGGDLPYNDNLVNLLLVDSPEAIPEQELLRVLVPGGVAFVKTAGDWEKLAKTPSPDLDDWTHALYDATGNAVSRDTIVAPSRHLQWFGGPRWGRQHEHMSSISALVSDGGRIFYIVDEGSRVSVMLPSKWQLVAKDAYNGSLLWKRPMPNWFSRYWPMKSGPVVLPRRLVAVGGKVFVTLDIDGPAVMLDAETGETIREYEQTVGVYELIVSDGVLFAVVSKDGRFYRHRRELEDMVAERNMIFGRSFSNDPREIVAIRTETGETLWKVESQVAQSSLAADGKHVAFDDNEGVVCLDRNTGQRQWKRPVKQQDRYQFGRGPTLVLAKDVVLFCGQVGTTTAMSAATGDVLWTSPQPATGHHSPFDVFVIDDQVWSGETASGRSAGTFTGRDLHSGEILDTFGMAKEPYWFHHRCHRGRATDNFIIASRTGTEFIDFRSGEYDVNHWVRGACTYGIMPANGLLYAPTHPCACYLSSKLSYFNALAPASRVTYREAERTPEQRRRQGPADGAAQPSPRAADTAAEWPFYRHDAARSGATSNAVSPQVGPVWKTLVGGKLSSCTVAGGKVFVASMDRHTVYALAADTGKTAWQFTAGGRVDSPPAYVDGRVIFGSADGSVYCLAAGDGALIWRYDAAPQRRQMMAMGQLESPWPVHGAVFVQDDTVYCIAGRCRFLDGGMRMVMLDVKSGRLKSEKLLNERDMATGKNLHEFVRGLGMPTALSDVLSGNGKYIFMHSQVFDLQGNTLAAESFQGREDEIRHLFTPTGFLDDGWFHRSYWLYSTRFQSGWNRWYNEGRVVPAGRILVHQGSSVFGFGRKQDDFRWVTPLAYHLFCLDKKPSFLGPAKKEAGYMQSTPNKFKYHWSREVPLLVNAMVLSGDTLFVAGAPNILDEKEQWKHIYEQETQDKFAEQARLLTGADGGILWAVSARSGEKLSEVKLASIPAWDGMAAAYGRLYVPMRDGSLLCLGSR